MKTNVEPWRVLFRELDEAIETSVSMELPLESIELDEKEWKLLLYAYENFKVPRSKFGWEPAIYTRGTCKYRGTTIYKEKSQCSSKT